jgi:hypothetical protein
MGMSLKTGIAHLAKMDCLHYTPILLALVAFWTGFTRFAGFFHQFYPVNPAEGPVNILRFATFKCPG